MARKKKRRLLTIAKIIAATGLIGGGGYTATQSSVFTGDGAGASAEWDEEEVLDAQKVHGSKLIAEFDARGDSELQVAALLSDQSKQPVPKNVATVVFNDANSGSFAANDKQQTATPIEKPQGESKPATKPVTGSFAGFKKKPADNGFNPTANPAPKKGLPVMPPVVASFGDKQSPASGQPKPETKPPAQRSLDDLIAKKKTVSPRPSSDAAGASAKSIPTSQQPPAKPSSAGGMAFSAKTAGQFGATSNTQPAPIIPQTKPQPATTQPNFENASAVTSRPPRDARNSRDLLAEADKPQSQSASAAKSVPAVIPKKIDPRINSQFSSAVTAAAGGGAPFGTQSIDKPQQLPSKAAQPIARNPQLPNGDQTSVSGGLANNRTLGNTFSNSQPNSLQAAPPRLGGVNSNPNGIPANNASLRSNTQSPGSSPGRLRPVGGSTPSAGITSVSTAAGTGSLTGAPGNTPGDRGLEGIQTPTLSLEKSAPREIQVGRPATFKLIVRNNGRVPAYGVTVVDEVPKGTQMQATRPDPTSQAGSKMTWNLGTLQPGDSKEIAMELIPLERGEVGSVARVSFESQASVRTVCTKPQLEIQHTAPNKVLIGDSIMLRINVRNVGDGAATGVVIEENVPENMVHVDSSGRKLQYPIGTLAPNESRQITLRLRAEGPGQVRNSISATGDGKLSAQDALDIEIVAPKLQLDARGPNKRFLERQATYDLAVANLGTASATNVQLVARLPRGLKFVETDKNGQYDPRSHAVFWSLIELPPETKGEVKLTLLPIDTGNQKIDFEAKADLNINQKRDLIVAVDQYSELFFDVDDVADPIEVGSETVYHVRVVNQGSNPATGVQVKIQLPPELQANSASGPTQYQNVGGAIVFAPIDRLAPKGEAKFEILVEGKSEGDHRITVQLSSNERTEVVAKEESTKVYSDYR